MQQSRGKDRSPKRQRSLTLSVSCRRAGLIRFHASTLNHNMGPLGHIRLALLTRSHGWHTNPDTSIPQAVLCGQRAPGQPGASPSAKPLSKRASRAAAGHRETAKASAPNTFKVRVPLASPSLTIETTSFARGIDAASLRLSGSTATLINSTGFASENLRIRSHLAHFPIHSIDRSRVPRRHSIDRQFPPTHSIDRARGLK